jgi:phospholipid/cholesterol/gamma-HCH transport system substrate-binding protein
VKRASDRNPVVLAVVGLVTMVAVTVFALNLSRLPFFDHTATYQADFPNAAGLVANDIVTVDGVRVGTVKSLRLHGSFVIVTFTAERSIHLGGATTAAAKVQTPLGTEFLELSPSGPGTLRGPIPQSRVTVPYTLVGDLNQLTTQIEDYNIPQLVKALQTSSSTFYATPSSVIAKALGGLVRFSSIFAANAGQLHTIVAEGSSVAAVLNQHSAELVNLVGQGDLVLQVLQQRQTEIKQLLDGTASLSAQISSVLGTDHASLNALLQNLQSVSAALANDSAAIAKGIPLLAAFSRYAANITGSGPFADASVPTLLIPDNLIAQCSKPGAFPEPSNTQVGCRP